MKTDVRVMVLVTVAGLAAVYAYILDWRLASEKDRFLEWLKTERSAEWGALTRSDRFLSIRAVEILRRGPLADDSEFHARYQLTRPGRRFLTAIGVSATAIALTLLGTTVFDWNW